MHKKSQVINKKEALRQEYLDKLEKIRKGKYLKFNSIDELRTLTI